MARPHVVAGHRAQGRPRRLAGGPPICRHVHAQLAAARDQSLRRHQGRRRKAWKEDNERGFDPEQAPTILSATVATPSHLISREMKAARRWVPWICAYTDARVNEITSLLPSDAQQIEGHWCLVLRPDSRRASAAYRFTSTCSSRDSLNTSRSVARSESRCSTSRSARGGKGSNPQWQKVAERLGEWVRESLKVTDVQPNHGWRHLWRETTAA